MKGNKHLLDRYILKKFLTVLFFTGMAFIVIFIVVDLIEHLDEFLSNNATLGDSILYYIYYVPYIIILTLPVNMLLSSLFSLGTMAQYNELVASLSAGVSLYRIFAPLLILAFMVSILSGVFSETIVTETNRMRLDIWRYDINKQKHAIVGNRSQIAVQDYNNRQVYIQYYEGRRQRANKVNIVWVQNNQITERWDVQYMNWNEQQKGWLLHNITQRQFTDTSELITRKDTLWYTDTHIFPEDLLELQVAPEEMNYQELDRFVNKMLAIGADARKWLVDLYMKISYPFSNFIIVLLGAPLASRKRRSGPALGFALALLISFIYFVFLRSGQVLGHKGTLDPWLGAWIGNIVFGIAGIVVMWRARK